MIEILNDLIEHRLLPIRGPKDEISLHRARLLAWVHLFAIVTSGILSMVSFFIEGQDSIPLITACLGSLFLAHIYKKYGNLNLSGNLLTFLLFGVLTVQLIPTGGLYSDNLLWMLLIPAVTFLFTTRNFGFVWSAVILAVIVGLYVMEIGPETSNREVTFGFDASYYLTSYLGLFILMIALMTLFVDGNKSLLESIHNTSGKLRARQDELIHKNRLLEKQEAALKRSNQDLELFASVASHDLKEPLRMINSYTQLLERNLKDSLSERDQEFLTYIKQGGLRMHTMLDDLLAYGKLGRNTSDLKPVDLEKSMVIVKNNLKLRLEESQGSITWNELPMILGHSTYFIQLFQNLIANSLKFRRDGVPPQIRITGEAQSENYVIQVSDNGIGIAEDEIDKVFGVFQRLSNSADFEGTGLGLATVKRIMDGFGGSIRVESTVGVGTTFSLSFPINSIVVLAKAEALVHKA